jgi:hypothetical protein
MAYAENLAAAGTDHHCTGNADERVCANQRRQMLLEVVVGNSMANVQEPSPVCFSRRGAESAKVFRCFYLHEIASCFSLRD